MNKDMKEKTNSSINEASQLDKRPWVMDWLFEIGHNMAIINHCYEKIQYLTKDIQESQSDEEAQKLVEKLSNYHYLRELAYQDYDLQMTYLFDTIPESEKDNRCLLKHASTKLVMAQETTDSLNNSTSDRNLELSFKLFAGAVSLALGIDFHACLRCIYDGVKKASEQAKTINRPQVKVSL